MINVGDNIKILTCNPYSTPFMPGDILIVYSVDRMTGMIEAGRNSQISIYSFPLGGQNIHFEYWPKSNSLPTSTIQSNALDLLSKQESKDRYEVDDIVEYVVNKQTGAPARSKVIAVRNFPESQILLLETGIDITSWAVIGATRKADLESKFKGSHTLGYDPDVDNFWDYKEQQ